MKRDKKNNSYETAIVKIKVVYEPVLVGNMVCPYCSHEQEDIFDPDELDRKNILHCCEICDKCFYIDIPGLNSFKKPKLVC